MGKWADREYQNQETNQDFLLKILYPELVAEVPRLTLEQFEKIEPYFAPLEEELLNAIYGEPPSPQESNKVTHKEKTERYRYYLAHMNNHIEMQPREAVMKLHDSLRDSIHRAVQIADSTYQIIHITGDGVLPWREGK